MVEAGICARLAARGIDVSAYLEASSLSALEREARELTRQLCGADFEVVLLLGAPEPPRGPR
jgi:hypothetical protein